MNAKAMGFAVYGKLKMHEGTYFLLRSCTACGQWIGWTYDAGLFFDGRCGCAGGPMRPHDVQDIVNHFERNKDNQYAKDQFESFMRGGQ